jgi:hypothetical protein
MGVRVATNTRVFGGDVRHEAFAGDDAGDFES